MSEESAEEVKAKKLQVIRLAEGERLRRVSEGAEAEKVAKFERRKSVEKAVALAEDERERRIDEKFIEAAENSLSYLADTIAAKEMVAEASEKERTRRVSLTVSDEAASVARRRSSVTEVTEASEKERTRRVSITVTDEAASVARRKSSVTLVNEAEALERAARVAAEGSEEGKTKKRRASLLAAAAVDSVSK